MKSSNTAQILTLQAMSRRLFLPLSLAFFLLTSCEDQITQNFYKGELLTNGTFENISGTSPSDWTLQANQLGNVNNSIISSTGSSGRGLRFTHAEGTGCWEMWIEQNLDLSELVADQLYELTFDYQVSFGGARVSATMNGDISSGGSHPLNSGSGWQSGSIQFRTPKTLSNNSRFMLHFCIQGMNSWSIDQLSLKFKE
ncbi:MAG TPA: hypothetical protein DCS15_02580 [Flavobacteriales bacterium]|jgi:hypothetical protein|nr:hypothetical protein [Flavobacteriales bacterium]